MPDCCCPPAVLPLPLLLPLLPRASLALFKRLDMFVDVLCEVGFGVMRIGWRGTKATRSRAELCYMPWSYVLEFIACVIAR